LTSVNFWSTAHQLALKRSKNYEAIFSQSKAEFRRHDHDVDTHTEIAVSPEDDVEIRRTAIRNRSRKQKTIDVTSYAEVVLTSLLGDALHPAFSNLFVQTEIMRRQRTIICTRRPRSVDEQMPWMFHLMVVQGGRPVLKSVLAPGWRSPTPQIAVLQRGYLVDVSAEVHGRQGGRIPDVMSAAISVFARLEPKGDGGQYYLNRLRGSVQPTNEERLAKPQTLQRFIIQLSSSLQFLALLKLPDGGFGLGTSDPVNRAAVEASLL